MVCVCVGGGCERVTCGMCVCWGGVRKGNLWYVCVLGGGGCERVICGMCVCWGGAKG